MRSHALQPGHFTWPDCGLRLVNRLRADGSSEFLTAGVEAFASAFPAIWPHRISVALIILLLITMLNLRGLRETGTIMSIPVYLFLFTYIPMLAIGAYQLYTNGPVPLATAAPTALMPLSLLLILHAFSAGCTALTGIESSRNGVPAFKRPNRATRESLLIVMSVLMAILFLGSIGLTQYLGIVAGPRETILSALARQILGSSPAYYLIQTATLLILAVAANTSFARFHEVAAILSSDGFLPRQLTGLGDRLVYANGIVLLSLATAFLIIVFQGHSHALVPLFAVGAFLAFTLSQAIVSYLATRNGKKLAAKDDHQWHRSAGHRNNLYRDCL